MEKIKRQIEGLNNTSAEVKYGEQHAFIDYWTVLVTLMFISSFFSLFLLIFFGLHVKCIISYCII